MNKRMENLLNYEKRVIEDRRQLSKLIEESDVEDTQFMKEKLNFLQQEIGYLSRQVEFLKWDTERREHSHIQPQTYTQGVEPATQSKYENQRVTRVEPVSQNVYRNGRMSGREQIPQQISKKRDMEKTVGKSIMGILASGLIFISLILFATLLLPYFNNTAKMITTYAISFAFTGIGLFKLKKDKNNKFFVALTGCGIGAIYISLLLSNMYFKVIGDTALYFLICLWSVGVCLLARLKNKVFQIIGELGILVSVIFGCILCNQDSDKLKFLVLIIYYIISSRLFYFTHYRKEFIENMTHHVFNIINCIVLMISSLGIVRYEKNITNITLVILLILAVISVCEAFIHKLEKSNISFGVIASTYICMIFCLVEGILDNQTAYAIIAYMIFLLFMSVLQFKKVNGKVGKNIIYLILIIMAITSLNSYDSLYDYGLIPMLVIPLLLLGFYNKNSMCKYTTLVLLFLYTFTSYYIGERLHFGLELTAFVLIFYLIYRCKEQYSRAFKYFAHTAMLFFLVMRIGDITGDVAAYMVVAGFNIVMLKSCFGKNILTSERENPALYHIVNLITMIYGMGILGANWNPVEHFILILIVVTTFMVNTKNILNKRNHVFAGMYVGFKFTTLMIVILNSFDAVNYVISIACFVFAILSIIIGFKKDYKSLRIFGLILSMISTFKLIMIDITYDNTLGNAISFFISGILCFVISLIYNYIDGKVKRGNQNT